MNFWKNFIYKPGSTKIYWEKIISSLIVIIIIGVFAYYNQGRLNKFKKQRNDFEAYTIGKITNTHRTNLKASPFVDYEYFYNNNRYSNSETWHKSIFKVPESGERYFVKFAANNPQNSELLFDFSVPDSIIEAPDSGWIYMPGYGGKPVKNNFIDSN